MTKRRQEALKLIDKSRHYDVNEAIALVKKTATAKFDESIEVTFRLGVNPKHADQQIRGAMVLPHGTGKTQTVLVIARDDAAKAAEAAGADFVGAEDMIERIQKENWFGFDVIVATPNMMGLLGRLGRILGPKGLMPNPKTGTVTNDVEKAVNDIKAGKIEYRVDKEGNVHVIIGKASFEDAKIRENFQAIFEVIDKARPASAKGTYMRNLAISSTMGVGIKVDTNSFDN